MLLQVLIVVSLFHMVFAQTISPTTNRGRFTVEDPDKILDTMQPPVLSNNDPSNKNDIDYYADLPSAQDAQEDDDGDSVNFGGMLLDPNTFRALFVTRTPLSSDLLWVKDKSYFTPEVPYGFTSTGKPLKELFKEVMKEWSRGTCLKFRSYVEGEDSHILAFSKENTCSVHLGKQKKRVQYLTVSDECSTKQDISTSLGVALGFLYQRLRSDRDDYITINYPSVDPLGRYFFDKVSNESYYTHGIPFDYTSVMQEPPLIFSRDGTQP
ncbi:zinc metalloproteinase nas-34-like [Macrobrachium nipponense]|uniref:zinc metalloproteinase nas-34-like n=1 Tax=Macrobrachium nipponense TaxID=159736 RepID=UPI0030C7F2F5